MHSKFFLGNFEFPVFEGVYPPSEDSELLAGAVCISKGAFLDMGCGTGIQGLNAIIKGASFVCFADANAKALTNAKRNFELLKKQGFKAGAEFVETDLFSKIRKKFDFIAFNPPYVPSEKKFLDLDGGKKGREILDKFLSQASKFLLPEGKIFFLQSSLNGILETEKVLKQKNLGFKIIARQKLFFEELVVFEAGE